MPKRIILLSGPIGAGKSTVAKEMVALSANSTIYIEGDIFWSFLTKNNGGNNPGRYFKMTMTAMIAAALPYALYEHDVIVDFSIPPWFLETVHKVIKGKVPVHYVVLRPTEAICAARAATRAEGKIDDYAKYHELYTSFDEVQRNIIADDTSDAATIAEYVIDGVEEGVFLI